MAMYMPASPAASMTVPPLDETFTHIEKVTAEPLIVWLAGTLVVLR
jgi:hypothetical protein